MTPSGRRARGASASSSWRKASVGRCARSISPIAAVILTAWRSHA